MKNILHISVKDGDVCNLISNVDIGSNKFVVVVETIISLNPKLHVGNNVYEITEEISTWDLTNQAYKSSDLIFYISYDGYAGEPFTVKGVNSSVDDYMIKKIDDFNYKFVTEIDEKIKLLNVVYPVGSIYISVNNTNPSQLFGGTWAAFGTGRALVGVDASQAEFNSAEKQGGEKTHTLTTQELASHNHGSVTLKGLVQFRDINSSDSSLVLSASGIVSKSYPEWSGSHAALTLASKANYKYNRLDINATHEHSSAGGGAAHNNLQPYITVYMWKRTV